MAWNEPDKDKNPWNKGSEQGPPDLDELLRNIQKRANSWFGKGGGSGGKSRSANPRGFGVILLGLIGLWALTGFYKIDAQERGVVLRFGEYTRTAMPGLHWHAPYPFEHVETVGVSQIDRVDYKTQMLTADENIVAIEMTVQFRRADAQAYLFNVRDPDQTVMDVSESAIREVVGKSAAESVLQEGRREISVKTRELIQATLDEYGTGIEVTSVNLVDATPPSQVQAAVDDATKAREDKERFVLEAEAYINDILPRARGAAQRRIEEAIAYKEQVIADAEGQTARFLQLLAEYEKAPEITRKRLFLETMERVFEGSNKVILDSESGNNLLYLPVDKLTGRPGRAIGADAIGGGGGDAQSAPGADPSTRPTQDRRSRGTR
jgi:membrane protease subunit HflK